MHDKSDSQPQILTIRLLRLVGYVLLLLSCFDIISLFIPPRFMNPEWEVQVMTELVERVAVPLIGLALVFYQDIRLRVKLEIVLLKGFSWAALGVGVAYLLLLPLIVVNSFRLDTVLIGQANTFVNQRMTQTEQIQQRLRQATSKTEVNVLFIRLSGQTLPPNLADKDLPELKQEVLATLDKGKPNIRRQAEAAGVEQRLQLLKTALKTFLGALISGFCFIYIWSLTSWIRQLRLEKRPMTTYDATD
jgi:hypothetical protein